MLTWSHRFNRRVHTVTEAYTEYEFDGQLGGNENDGPVQSFGNGGGGAAPVIPGRSGAQAIVNYTQYMFNPKDYATFRSDFLDDGQGQRTGVPNRYSSYTLGLTHWTSHNIIVRPEIRYERAWDNPVYDNGTRQNQVLVQSDLILRF